MYEIQYGLPSNRGGNRLLGERERLFDAAARLEAVDVGGQAVAPIASVPLRHHPGELDVTIEVTAVDVAESLDERRVPGLTRVVAGVRFQFCRSVPFARAASARPGEKHV